MRRLWKDSALGFLVHEIVRRPLGLILLGLAAGIVIGLFFLH